MTDRHTGEALRPFLKALTTLADAESELELNAWTSDALDRWKRFAANVGPDDRLWFFRDITGPREGFGGYVVERDGVLCEFIVTERY